MVGVMVAVDAGVDVIVCVKTGAGVIVGMGVAVAISVLGTAVEMMMGLSITVELFSEICFLVNTNTGLLHEEIRTERVRTNRTLRYIQTPF